MSPTVSINIVAWNSMKYLPDLFVSIFAQTYRDFVVMVIDNGSTDGVETFLREHYPSVRYIRNARNLGFAGAHNQGIRYAIEHWGEENLNNKFVLVTNPDILFTPTYLETVMKCVETHQTTGIFGGKLLRAYGEGLQDEILKETIHSDRLDSTGLRLHKNFTCTDRGAGELDKGQFQKGESVFGISGALALYRARALISICFEDEYFDHDFFAYKEDVDLAWRMHYAGWRAWYEPDAVAYHYRGLYGKERIGIWERMKKRKQKSRVLSYYSTRNHWLLLLKVIDFRSGISAFPQLFAYEFVRCLYVVFFEFSGGRVFLDALKLFPRMWKKHRLIQKTKVVSGYKIRKEFTRCQ